MICGEPSQGPAATDGDIAALNLESTRRRAWARFLGDPRLAGVAEALVELECLRLQFLGDLGALDRLVALALQFARVDASWRAALVEVQVASTLHRFGHATEALARGVVMGAPDEAIERQTLTINQACGVQLDAVLAARRRRAVASGRLEELIPLGAVLADLERYEEADLVYRQALSSYDGVSPFFLAWVCFQLGLLWGEVIATPDRDVAAAWYERAIAYVPGYAKARVHLAEIRLGQHKASDAEALLLPVVPSGDPEVRWRLADVLVEQGRSDEAASHLRAARAAFDAVLARHLLAFADHGAEFYASSGNDHARALALARANVANRPTRRAVEQAQEIVRRSASPGCVASR